MKRLVLALFACLAVTACASAETTPPAEGIEAIAACQDSRGADCDNGRPLCMMDEDRACRMCHCSEYALAAPSPVVYGQGGTGVPATVQYLLPPIMR